jgi:hypothetical protein
MFAWSCRINRPNREGLSQITQRATNYLHFVSIIQSANYGLLSSDRRHNLVINSIYDLPRLSRWAGGNKVANSLATIGSFPASSCCRAVLHTLPPAPLQMSALLRTWQALPPKPPTAAGSQAIPDRATAAIHIGSSVLPFSFLRHRRVLVWNRDATSWSGRESTTSTSRCRNHS